MSEQLLGGATSAIWLEYSVTELISQFNTVDWIADFLLHIRPFLVEEDPGKLRKMEEKYDDDQK